MERTRSASSARVQRAKKRQKLTKKGSKKKIDFSDIPELSDKQLKSMKRVGRPPIGDSARHLIAIRIDPRVLQLLQSEAKKDGKGYQTLINEILAEYVKSA